MQLEKMFENMLIVPSKSRYELQLEKCGNEEAARIEFRSDEVWKSICESHYAQEANKNKVAENIGRERMIDRSYLTDEMIEEHDVFAFLGGDNHFTFCSQLILRYCQKHPFARKYVIGSVLDPKKSWGGLLYFDTDKLLDSLDRLKHGDYSMESWAVLEAVVDNGLGEEMLFPAVGDYSCGEYSDLQMSRNLIYIDERLATPEYKSSSVLIAIGASSGKGAWYYNVYRGWFDQEDEFSREDECGRIALRENYKRIVIPFEKGQTVRIDSYNDSHGVIVPDSHEDHMADFQMGAKAEIRISDLKLRVINV